MSFASQREFAVITAIVFFTPQKPLSMNGSVVQSLKLNKIFRDQDIYFKTTTRLRIVVAIVCYAKDLLLKFA